MSDPESALFGVEKRFVLQFALPGQSGVRSAKGLGDENFADVMEETGGEGDLSIFGGSMLGEHLGSNSGCKGMAPEIELTQSAVLGTFQDR